MQPDLTLLNAGCGRYTIFLLRFEGKAKRLNSHRQETRRKNRVLMLLTNAFNPDPRVYLEATSLIKHGYKVTVMCWDRELKANPCEIIDEIRVERIFVRSKHGKGTAQIPFLLLFWLKVFTRVVMKRFNVIHCHDFDTLPLGFILSKLTGARIIYDSHESYVDMLAENVNKHLKKFLTLFENLLIIRVNWIITVGQNLSYKFVARGAKRATVVGNWKNLSHYNIPLEKLDALKARLSITKGKILISYIGHLHPRRIIIQLLDSVSSKDAYALIIGGYGELVDIVKYYAENFDNIKYLGYVKFQDIPLYTGICDIVYSAFDFEHLMAKYVAPNKLFDALAAGKAVLTGDFGEIGQIVKENKCGIVLKNYEQKSFDEALDTLAENKNILSFYFANAKKASQKYNWSVAEQVLLKVYNEG